MLPLALRMKALDNYYDQYLTTSPSYSFDLIEILDMTRPEGYHTFPITIRFQVQPYVGPHDIIGIDQIIMKVGTDEGDVKVEKFEHIKSYYTFSTMAKNKGRKAISMKK